MKKTEFSSLFQNSFKPWTDRFNEHLFFFIRKASGQWELAFTTENLNPLHADVTISFENLPEDHQLFTLQQMPKTVQKVLGTWNIAWGMPLSSHRYVVMGRKMPARDQTIIFDLCARVFELLVRNSELEGELRRTARQMQNVLEETSALHEISRALDSITSLDSLLHDIVQKSMHLMNAESGSLMLFTEDGEELEFRVALGPKSKHVKPFRIKLGQGISGWVAQHGEPILIKDAYQDERFDPSFDKRSGYRTRTFLCVPLKYKEQILGVITILNRLDNRAFSEKDLELLLTFSTQAALAIENTRLLQEAIEQERLKADLKIAAEIQRLLIPTDLPEVKGVELSATYIPCKEMSGDFYDVIAMKNGKWAFVMADVSGKSIPGAMLMSNFQASIRTYFQFSTDLLWIVENLNETIIKQTTSDRYITVFCAVYDPQTGLLECINAGHNPPILLRKGTERILLNKGGIFLGLMTWKYEIQTVQLEKGDLLVIYTDGLVEAMNEKEEEFGLERLEKLVKKNIDQPLRTLEDTIVKAVKRHVGSGHLEDDFTLMMLRKNI